MIDQLAHNLRKTHHTFIVGQSGVGKTQIVKRYLEGLKINSSNACVVSKEMEYKELKILELNSLLAPQKIIDALDAFCYPLYDDAVNPYYKDIIFDDFQVFLNNPDNFKILQDWICENLDDDNIRFIFVTQKIDWKMMPIISECSTLYLGKNDEINIRRYKNFIRLENSKINNFMVVNK